MTKKDFILIAAALKATKPSKVFRSGSYDARRDEWDIVIARFCVDLKSANPRFNTDKFLAACGVEGL